MAYTTLQQAVDALTVKNQALTDQVLAADTKSTQDKDAAVTARQAAEAAEQGANDARDLADQHQAAAALSETNAQAAQAQAEAQVPLATTEADRAVAARDAAVLTALGPDNDRLASVASVYGMPSLNLDFAKQEFWKQGTYPWNRQTLDPNVDLTVQRASTKWVFDATGTLVEVPIDTLAFDHDPVTGEPLGVLIEESRTNKAVRSDDFSTTWLFDQAFVTLNATTAPDGTQTAAKLIADTAVSYHYMRQATSASSNPHAFSIYVKAAEYSTVTLAHETFGNSRADFDLSTGSVTKTLNCTARIVAVGGGWYRCVMLVSEVLSNTYGFIVTIRDQAFTGNGTSGIYVWGAQLEEGTFPTSYIPTAGAPVTRAKDVPRRAMGSEGNPTTFTLFVETEKLSPAGVPGGFYFLTDGTTNTRVGLAISASSLPTSKICAYSKAPGKPLYIIYGQSVTPGSGVHKIAVTFTASEIRICVDGGEVFVSPYVGLPDGLNMLGDPTDGFGNAGTHTKRIHYFPRAMTPAELQEVTTL